MKAKLMVNGKEFDIEILDLKLQELIAPKQKTGYERADNNEEFYWIDGFGDVIETFDIRTYDDNERYDVANYYTNEAVAKNNARADKLMQQLRRFAVEHRVEAMDWGKSTQNKYYIFFNHQINKIIIEENQVCHSYGTIYFDSYSTTQLAIDTFKDELTWYFTEYKDSL